MSKRILITGAGSGFGEGAALGLAQQGHDVIAAVQIQPQKTALERKAAKMGLKNIRVEKLDQTNSDDIAAAHTWEIDTLALNAGIGNGGPISEIPIPLVRAIFETNYFGGLALIQGFVKKWVAAHQPGKIVLTGSVAGVVVGPGVGAYCATKFAIESMAWALRVELARHNIKVQVINPGPYFTGFNETLLETAYRWLDNPDAFTTPDEFREMSAWIGKLDPQECINEMIRIIPSDEGKHRNIVPASMAADVRKTQESVWDWTIQDV